MNYDDLESMEKLIYRAETNENDWKVAGEQAGTTPIVTMQDDEIYAYDMPIYGDWCE